MYILYMYLVLWHVYSEINISYLILSYRSVLSKDTSSSAGVIAIDRLRTGP